VKAVLVSGVVDMERIAQMLSARRAAREEAYFAVARIDDDELRDAAAEDEQRRAKARARHADATRSNLGLGHDIRAGLLEPSDAQLRRSGTSSATCSFATTAS
jgi:hypothetical protein